MLDRYNRLPYNYQSKTGYDTFIQNVILEELINIMVTTITDLDIELKMKISRIDYLENKKVIEFVCIIILYMYESDICLAKIKNETKMEHEKSMKHRYFLSNMLVKKIDINKVKNILQSYCDEHKKNLL